MNNQAFHAEQNETAARRIRQLALDLGFHACGYAAVRPLLEEAIYLDRWLAQGMHASMYYMENNRDKRLDPSLMLEDVRSVICLSHNYSPAEELPGPYRIARYAYGIDYHKVLKKKIRPLLALLSELGSKTHRGFTDSAPVMERSWAREAGMGWIGKNSLLITPDHGSYFFLAEIFTDLILPADAPRIHNQCGSCTRCMTACPTGAIVSPGVVDARRCISYLTIENRDEIPQAFKGQYEHWVFGCDICQEVCPWNSKKIPHHEPAFQPSTALKNINLKEWESLDQESYARLFSGTPVDRAGLTRLKRNISFLSKNEAPEKI